jgi:uncharacterized protein (DUF433 family)
MKEQQLLERITLNPKIMAGKPMIKGTRLTVEYILGLLAQGATPAEILEEYDGLTPEDLQACLLFATAEKFPAVTTAIQEPEMEKEIWLNLSAQGLTSAYDDDEPEYSVTLVKEQNPERV